MALASDLTFWNCGFTDEEAALVLEAAEASRCPPAILIASIVSQVLKDNAADIAEGVPIKGCPSLSLH